MLVISIYDSPFCVTAAICKEGRKEYVSEELRQEIEDASQADWSNDSYRNILNIINNHNLDVKEVVICEDGKIFYKML